MKSFLAAILVSAALASGASAATVSTVGEFNSKLPVGAGAPQLESFDGFSTEISLVGTKDFGAFTTTLNATNPSAGFNTVRTGGDYNSSGLSGPHLHIGLLNDDSFTITFKSAIVAFGALFAGVNNGDERSELFIDGMRYDEWLGITNGTSIDGETRFFGVVRNASFKTITFQGRPPSEGFGLDELRWAYAPVPVPVPASGVLLMGAMVVAGWFGRRRARA